MGKRDEQMIRDYPELRARLLQQHPELAEALDTNAAPAPASIATGASAIAQLTEPQIPAGGQPSPAPDVTTSSPLEPVTPSRVPARARRELPLETEPPVTSPPWLRAFVWGSGAVMAICAALVVLAIAGPHGHPLRPAAAGSATAAMPAPPVPATSQPTTDMPAQAATPGLQPPPVTTQPDTSTQPAGTPSKPSSGPGADPPAAAPPPQPAQPGQMATFVDMTQMRTDALTYECTGTDGSGFKKTLGWTKDDAACQVFRTRDGLNPPQAACPGPITGHISSVWSGRRIQLEIAVNGPSRGDILNNAILDTGGVVTTFPDSFLRKLGYTPVAGPYDVGGISSGTSQAYDYVIQPISIGHPQGGWTVLGGTSMRVRGVVGFGMVLLGPELIQQSKISLSTSGNDWTVSFPCR